MDVDRRAIEQLSDDDLDGWLALLLLERQKRREKDRPTSFIEDIRAGLAAKKRD